jgi:outer membrane protein TolC
VILRALALLALAAPAARAASPSPSLLAEVYTIEDALRLGQRNDAELQTAEQDITIAHQRAREASFLFYPEVGLQATGTRYDARYPFALRPGFASLLLFPSEHDNFLSGQAYMNLSLYEGGRHINTLRLAQTALKQAESKYEAVKLDIDYNIKRAFYRFMLAQQILSSLDGAGPAFEALETARGGPVERIEAQSVFAEFRAELSTARRDLELSRLDFLKALNRELDVPATVQGVLETRPALVDIKQALVWATELRPELQSQTYKAQMDAISVNLALGRRNPTVLLGLDYGVNGYDFPLRQNNWDATVGVKLPFNFDYWTQHTQKVAEQRQGEIARAELNDRVQLEVRKAHQELLHWQQEYPLRESEFRSMRLALSTLPRDARGTAPLQARLHVLRAERGYLEAVTEHILARARLERAIGRTLP